MGITLDQLLAARDRRRERQLHMLAEYPGLALIVLTVNIPGAEKRTEASVGIGDAGVSALHEKLGADVRVEERYDLDTGFEAFICASVSLGEAKRIALSIEESHPLGRIMDIDVIGEEGVPVSRGALGYPGRRCFLCGQPARICMRTAAHSPQELSAYIERQWHDYVRRS